MPFYDEKDYVMRLIKQMTELLVSLVFGREYTVAELWNVDKITVYGMNLDKYEDMVDNGDINEAENRLIEGIDFSDRYQILMAILFYKYIGEKDEEFLVKFNYSKEEVVEGLQYLAEKTGYGDVIRYLTRNQI